jgi:hypothetical protein
MRNWASWAGHEDRRRGVAPALSVAPGVKLERSFRSGTPMSLMPGGFLGKRVQSAKTLSPVVARHGHEACRADDLSAPRWVRGSPREQYGRGRRPGSPVCPAMSARRSRCWMAGKAGHPRFLPYGDLGAWRCQPPPFRMTGMSSPWRAAPVGGGAPRADLLFTFPRPLPSPSGGRKSRRSRRPRRRRRWVRRRPRSGSRRWTG